VADSAPPPPAGDSSTLDQLDANARSCAASRDPSKPLAPCPAKTWIGVRLVDMDGQPVPGILCHIKLPDGSEESAKLDDAGSARWDNLDPGSADISFPELDGREWWAQGSKGGAPV